MSAEMDPSFAARPMTFAPANSGPSSTQVANLDGRKVEIITAEDEVTLQSILRTVVGVALTALVFAGIMYAAGFGIAGAGHLLSGRALLATPSQLLITVGNAVANAGVFVCKVVTTPIYLVGYKLPSWLLETVLPRVKQHTEQLIDRVIDAVKPCFAALQRRLGIIGDVIGAISHWLIHHVAGNVIKMIDKFITSIWKGMATSILYAVSKVAPGGGWVMTKVMCTKDYLLGKLFTVYKAAANSFLKPVIDTVRNFIQKFFGSVSRRAVEPSASAVAYNMADALAATPVHVQRLYAEQQEILAIAQLAMA